MTLCQVNNPQENRRSGRREGFAVARLEWEHDAEAVSNQESSQP